MVTELRAPARNQPLCWLLDELLDTEDGLPAGAAGAVLPKGGEGLLGEWPDQLRL